MNMGMTSMPNLRTPVFTGLTASYEGQDPLIMHFGFLFGTTQM